jgi:hypothetical protein
MAMILKIDSFAEFVRGDVDIATGELANVLHFSRLRLRQ